MEHFPRIRYVAALCEVTDLQSRLGETPENFTGRILFMSMFNDISCGTKDNERECLANAEVVSIFAKKFGVGQWSFIGPGSEKKWYSMEEDSSTRNLGSHRGQDVVGICRKHMSNFPCYDSIVQRSAQKQRPWNIVDTRLCRFGNDLNFFAQSLL